MATPRRRLGFTLASFPSPPSAPCTAPRGDFPSGKKGDVLTVWFTVMGIPCLGLNGGSSFKHNEAFSFQVATADQAETDRYWNAIIGNGGQESECGQRSRSRRRQARVRCYDDDEKDRHRRHRGGPPRVRLRL
jgi:hypothetical protein